MSEAVLPNRIASHTGQLAEHESGRRRRGWFNRPDIAWIVGATLVNLFEKVTIHVSEGYVLSM
jgi:hypothetical protein